MKNTYTIIDYNLEKVQAYITKVNKRAKKLGQKEVTIKIVKEHTETRKHGDEEYLVNMLDIEIEAEIIKVEGYKFVASIEHFYEAGNIVHKLDSEIELPKEYFTIDGNCEHCHTNRRRKKTVILMNEEGKFIQIGRSCLKDFIGYDVDSFVSIVGLIESIQAELEEIEGEKFNVGSYHPIYLMEEYLYFVEQEINENGWVSKSNARTYEESTMYLAEKRMLSYKSEDKVIISDFVKEALTWIRNIDADNNDYLHNLQVLCKQEYVRIKDIGFVASLLNAYQKTLDKEKEKKIQQIVKAKSEHVGTVGKRDVFELTLAKCFGYYTVFGYMHIFKFIDNNGNTFIWKTSNGLGKEVGDKLKLKATIKEHGEYDGEKQTVITRCKEVK
jgi:hypothetical protein